MGRENIMAKDKQPEIEDNERKDKIPAQVK